MEEKQLKFNLIVLDHTKEEDEQNLVYSLNSNFSEIRQLIFGISSSTKDLFGEEPYIHSFTENPKEQNAHLHEETTVPPERIIVVAHRSKIYVFMIIFENELLQNTSFPEDFCRCTMNELKYFLMFHQKKLNTIQELKNLMGKVGARIEYYLSIIKNIKNSDSFFLHLKLFKMVIGNKLPFIPVDSATRDELASVLSQTYLPVSDFLKLFEKSKSNLIALGHFLSFKGVFLFNTLPLELTFYLKSLSELYNEKEFNYFYDPQIFNEEISFQEENYEIFIVLYDEYVLLFLYLILDPVLSNETEITLLKEKIKYIVADMLERKIFQRIYKDIMPDKVLNKEKEDIDALLLQSEKKLYYQLLKGEVVTINDEFSMILFDLHFALKDINYERAAIYFLIFLKICELVKEISAIKIRKFDNPVVEEQNELLKGLLFFDCENEMLNMHKFLQPVEKNKENEIVMMKSKEKFWLTGGRELNFVTDFGHISSDALKCSFEVSLIKHAKT